MSATNRTNVRKPYDFYSTPVDCIENLLNNIDLYEADEYEPYIEEEFEGDDDYELEDDEEE